MVERSGGDKKRKITNDCLKCHKGYKLNFGICEIKEQSKKILFLKIVIPIIIVILIVYLYLYRKKKAREKIETGQVIKFSHPKSGFYKLNFDKNNLGNNEEFQEFSQNKSLSSSNSDSGGDKDSPEVRLCVVCGSKKTYTIADCGCSLCLDDYKTVKGEKERIKCRIHNVFLSSNISFEMFNYHKKRFTLYDGFNDNAKSSKLTGNNQLRLNLQDTIDPLPINEKPIISYYNRIIIAA